MDKSFDYKCNNVARRALPFFFSIALFRSLALFCAQKQRKKQVAFDDKVWLWPTK